MQAEELPLVIKKEIAKRGYVEGSVDKDVDGTCKVPGVSRYKKGKFIYSEFQLQSSKKIDSKWHVVVRLEKYVEEEALPSQRILRIVIDDETGEVIEMGKDVQFNSTVISNAIVNQYDGRGMGPKCARCGKYTGISPIEGIDWYAIPRIPIKTGGKSADNCVIVCSECSSSIGQDGTKEIPYSDLPYFKVSRR